MPNTLVSLHLQKYVDNTRACDIFADHTRQRFAYSNQLLSVLLMITR